MRVERQLGRDELLENLEAVGRILDEHGIEANIYVIGGAAIALTINNRRTTSDVDAIVKTSNDAFRAAARMVAVQRNLPDDWCLDDVTEFISRNPVGVETPIVYPGLSILVASPEHLLAMKVRAATARQADDLADIVYLANYLGLDDPAEIASLTSKQFAGAYKDSIGEDEYIDTIEFAFLEAQLIEEAQGRLAVNAAIGSNEVQEREEDMWYDYISEEQSPPWRG